MKKYFWTLAIMAIFAIGFSASDEKSSSSNVVSEKESSNESTEENEKIAKKEKPEHQNDPNKMWEEYKKIVNEYNSQQTEDGYFTPNYFLFDITGDGVQELWLQISEGDNTPIKVYTFKEGKVVEIHKENFLPKHNYFYKNGNALLYVYASQGYASWYKYEYRNGKITSKQVKEVSPDSDDSDEILPPGPEIEIYKLNDLSIINNHGLENKEKTVPNNTSRNIGEKKKDLDWLQGHWIYQEGNFVFHYIIDGNKITQFSNLNPKRKENTFRIEGDELRARISDGFDLVVKIDFNNHTIDFGDGRWMRKLN